MCAYRVSIRVGTPPQWVNVFVSTASQETWVVGPGGGCAGSRSFIFFDHLRLISLTILRLIANLGIRDGFRKNDPKWVARSWHVIGDG